jgi:hypothetical protein
LEKNNTCQILIPKIKIILKYGFIYASIWWLTILGRTIKIFLNSLNTSLYGNLLVLPSGKKISWRPRLKVCVEWIQLTLVAGSCENSNENSGVNKRRRIHLPFTSWMTVSFSRSVLPGCINAVTLKCNTIHYLFFSWGETESTWYCGHCLAYCTSLGW